MCVCTCLHCDSITSAGFIGWVSNGTETSSEMTQASVLTCSVSCVTQTLNSHAIHVTVNLDKRGEPLIGMNNMWSPKLWFCCNSRLMSRTHIACSQLDHGLALLLQPFVAVLWLHLDSMNVCACAGNMKAHQECGIWQQTCFWTAKEHTEWPLSWTVGMWNTQCTIFQPNAIGETCLQRFVQGHIWGKMLKQTKIIGGRLHEREANAGTVDNWGNTVKVTSTWEIAWGNIRNEGTSNGGQLLKEEFWNTCWQKKPSQIWKMTSTHQTRRHPSKGPMWKHRFQLEEAGTLLVASACQRCSRLLPC
mgnify:CR=1 FL=1